MRVLSICLLLALGGLVFAQTPSKNPQDREGTLKVGDVAPHFKLKSLDGKQTVDLQQFKNKKLVVLVFGSYT